MKNTGDILRTGTVIFVSTSVRGPLKRARRQGGKLRISSFRTYIRVRVLIIVGFLCLEKNDNGRQIQPSNGQHGYKVERQRGRVGGNGRTRMRRVRQAHNRQVNGPVKSYSPFRISAYFKIKRYVRNIKRVLWTRFVRTARETFSTRKRRRLLLLFDRCSA